MINVVCLITRSVNSRPLTNGDKIVGLLRDLSQITFALRVGRWSEKRVVYYIKSAN